MANTENEKKFITDIEAESAKLDSDVNDKNNISLEEQPTEQLLQSVNEKNAEITASYAESDTVPESEEDSSDEESGASADTKEEKTAMIMPMIALRGTVAFPSIRIETAMTRIFSVKAVDVAMQNDGEIFLVAQKNIEADTPKMSDLYKIGTVCKVKNISRSSDGSETLNICFDGLYRAKLTSLAYVDGYFRAGVVAQEEIQGSFDDEEMIALMQTIGNTVAQLRNYIKNIGADFAKGASRLQTPSSFADYVASGVLGSYVSKQKVLESGQPLTKMRRLAVFLEEELQIAESEYRIHKKVKDTVDKQHREYYLREQMKAIQDELGEDNDEITELSARIESAKLPKEIEEKLNKELGRLSKTPYGAAESTVLRNYIETCLEIPFIKESNEKTDVEYARKVLNRDHDGMDKVKERILEYVAVRSISKHVNEQILCLVGAPGVGKTSVAKSIATALGRKYVRVSLGGIRDEADIRGHRKTYVGAMPGRIIEALIKVGVRNPVILLDELDKVTRDSHGDPASALLEVLDPEQNKYFRDHFVEMPVDLSDCIFIATANGYEGIPEPLIDRMEIIEIPSYSREEKLKIAENHLIPKQMKAHSMTKKNIAFDDSAILEIIDHYTREAGVRNLERIIAQLIRKTVVKIVDGEKGLHRITDETVRSLLKSHRIEVEKRDDCDLVGVVNGLAYTQAGGDLLKIETVTMPGTGKLEITGSLGEVMTESAKLAYSYVRSISDKTIINTSFYSNRDVHIHCPEGAVPKDGPSAGVTLMCSITSALSGIPVRSDVAMTGELSLTGRVLPIGGLREKTMAAYAAGVKTVLIPKKNECDLADVDPIVREHLNFILCSTADDILAHALSDYNALFTVKKDNKSEDVQSDSKKINTVVESIRIGAKQIDARSDNR